MSEPFIAEVRQFGFSFAPRSYAKCDGQILTINQNQSLFSLLGTNFGGDGESTFGLPELRGRAAIHPDDGSLAGTSSSRLGRKFGEQSVALNINQIPEHKHTLSASNVAATSPNPGGAGLATATRGNAYIPGTADKALSPASLADEGSGVAHDNMQPFLTVNFCIAIVGTFPSFN